MSPGSDALEDVDIDSDSDSGVESLEDLDVTMHVSQTSNIFFIIAMMQFTHVLNIFHYNHMHTCRTLMILILIKTMYLRNVLIIFLDSSKKEHRLMT